MCRACRRVGFWWKVRLQRLCKRQTRRVAVLDRHAGYLSIILYQINNAPVGDAGHREPGNGLQRRGVVDGFRKQPTGFRQEALLVCDGVYARIIARDRDVDRVAEHEEVAGCKSKAFAVCDAKNGSAENSRSSRPPAL